VLPCWRAHSGNANEALSPAAATRVLGSGFEAQSAGRITEALCAYRQVQGARSPLLRALGGNAEGLLLLRAPSEFRDSGMYGMDGAMSMKPGDAVLALWAEDGGEYAATIVSVDFMAGTCVVDWADGEDTHRVVSLAGVTTVHGGICSSAADCWPAEVQAWRARRVLRQAMGWWEMQAELGTAHDAFVDLAGLLSDLALAEAVAALADRAGGLVSGLERAQRHLQRARFVVDRAYRPDARAVAAVYLHRAEVLRLHAGVEAVAGAGAGPVFVKRLNEVLVLHERAASNAAVASWKTWKGPTSWQRLGDRISPEAVQELLRAKALASQAAAFAPKRSRVRSEMRRHGFLHKDGGRVTNVLSSVVARCPARAAVFHAWRALNAAVILAQGPAYVGVVGGRAASISGAGSAEAARLANCLEGGGRLHSLLLLEVAVIFFAMGCRIGRPTRARTLAAPLAQSAAQGLMGTGCADEAAARHVAAVLSVAPREDFDVFPGCIGRAELLSGCVEAQQRSTCGRAQLSISRWRLFKYSPVDELWILRLGSHGLVHLPAAPPLTWYLDGLALSETAPAADGEILIA